jgi:hypothetical protein
MRRPLDRKVDPAFCLRQASVLAFFSRRAHGVRIVLDDKLEEQGLATRDGVVLGPRAYGHDCEAAVLAHELFHYWCRASVEADLWSNLTCLVPSVLRQGSIEEIAVERLTRALCDRLDLPYDEPQPLEVPRDLLARRIRLARGAVGIALDDPRDAQRLLRARDALRALSSFEAASLALLDAPIDWIEPFASEVADVRALADKLVAELAGPQLLKALCRLFAKRQWNDHRRGPLWAGDNPLEVPPRVLHAQARNKPEPLAAFLKECKL